MLFDFSRSKASSEEASSECVVEAFETTVSECYVWTTLHVRFFLCRLTGRIIALLLVLIVIEPDITTRKAVGRLVRRLLHR